MIDYLVNKSADVNVTSKLGLTPLHSSALKGLDRPSLILIPWTMVFIDFIIKCIISGRNDAIEALMQTYHADANIRDIAGRITVVIIDRLMMNMGYYFAIK